MSVLSNQNNIVKFRKLNIDIIFYLINSSYSNFVKSTNSVLYSCCFLIQDSVQDWVLYLIVISLYLRSSLALSFMIYWHFFETTSLLFYGMSLNLGFRLFLWFDLCYRLFPVKLNKWWVFFAEYHWRHMSFCPLLVMLSLLIWLRHCSVSPLYSYLFLA